MRYFRSIPASKKTLPEIDNELAYHTKRLYRLRKLERLGKAVQPALDDCTKIEAELDMEKRDRLLKQI